MAPWMFWCICVGDLHDVLSNKEGCAQGDKLVSIFVLGSDPGQVCLPREIFICQSNIPLQDECWRCMQGWISLHEMSELEPEFHDGCDASGTCIDALVEVRIIQEDNNGVIPAVAISNHILQDNIGYTFAAGKPVHFTYPVMVPRTELAESHYEISVL